MANTHFDRTNLMTLLPSQAWLAPASLFLSLALREALEVPPEQNKPQEWRLVQDLRIAEVAGRSEYVFTRPAELAMAGDNSVFIVELSAGQIRHFSSRGQFIRAFGRAGRGPGEFRSIGNLGLVGDTVYAIDIVARRILTFSQNAELIQTVSFREQASSPGKLFYAMPSVLLSDGSAIGRAGTSGESVANGRVPRIPYLRSTKEGEILDTVVWVTAQRETPPGTPRIPLDLEDHPLSSIAPNGSLVVVVERAVSSSNRGAMFRVTAVTARGDTVFSRQFPYTPKAVPRGRRDSIIASAGTLDSVRRGSVPSSALGAFARSLPAHYPPVSEMLVADDGSVWLRREPNETGWTWDIIDVKGVHVGIVRTPTNSDLLAANRQTIWLIERDGLDTPTPVRYHLARASGVR